MRTVGITAMEPVFPFAYTLPLLLLLHACVHEGFHRPNNNIRIRRGACLLATLLYPCQYSTLNLGI